LDSTTDVQIDPDSNPDVCRIAAKISWICCLVGVSHLASYMKIGRWLYEKCW